MLSIEAIAIIFPIPADFAESIPEIASSTTIHSCGSSPNLFAAFKYISGAGLPGKVPSEYTILSMSNQFESLNFSITKG